jgi:hypothetical protein
MPHSTKSPDSSFVGVKVVRCDSPRGRGMASH